MKNEYKKILVFFVGKKGMNETKKEDKKETKII